MKLANPELRNRLAAEYVLGTMRGGARRRFAEMVSADSGLRRDVERWENHLTPLVERLRPVDAPARVWKKIQERIAVKSAAPVATSWWTRGKVGFASFAAAALLTAGLLPLLQAPYSAPPAPMLAAVLEDSNGPRMIVEQAKPGFLTVRMVKPWKLTAEQNLELWVIPSGGAPRSLGVVASDQGTIIGMPELAQKLECGLVFAVSQEPRGGSPTGAPTGPVLCKGAIAREAVKVKSQI